MIWLPIQPCLIKSTHRHHRGRGVSPYARVRYSDVYWTAHADEHRAARPRPPARDRPVGLSERSGERPIRMGVWRYAPTPRSARHILIKQGCIAIRPYTPVRAPYCNQTGLPPICVLALAGRLDSQRADPGAPSRYAKKWRGRGGPDLSDGTTTLSVTCRSRLNHEITRLSLKHVVLCYDSHGVPYMAYGVTARARNQRCSMRRKRGVIRQWRK